MTEKSASDVLRELLDERGIKYRTTEVHGMPVTLYESGGRTWSVTDHPNGYLVVNCVTHTPEQAIAATLGSDAKLCYATDYTHRHCKYSANRGWTEDTKFYIPTMRHGTLTAEQVEKAIRDCSTYASYDGCTYYASGIRLQAIADELNAELGNGTCRNEWAEFGKFRCSECWLQVDSISTNTTAPIPIKHCPNCGAKVIQGVYNAD